MGREWTNSLLYLWSHDGFSPTATCPAGGETGGTLSDPESLPELCYLSLGHFMNVYISY